MQNESECDPWSYISIMGVGVGRGGHMRLEAHRKAKEKSCKVRN